MTFTLTLGLPALMLIALSILLFVLATWICARQELFGPRGGDYDFGLGGLFLILIYAVLWGIPSLLAWAIWATWFK